MGCIGPDATASSRVSDLGCLQRPLEFNGVAPRAIVLIATIGPLACDQHVSLLQEVSCRRHLILHSQLVVLMRRFLNFVFVLL